MTVKLCAFDVETRHNIPEFVCGSVFSDESVEFFTNPSEMIERMRWHARKGYVLIAHHAEYDIGTLLWPAGEDVTIRYASNIYTTATWRYGPGRRTATIWDNMRLCAGMSLEALGDAIAIPKLSTPRRLIDSDDIRRDWVCDSHGVPGCLECYTVRDSEIVWCYANALQEWLGAYGLRLHYSLARSAIELWSFLDPGQSQRLTSQRIKDLARRAYHGGRCEVFQYGRVGRTYTADFRSYYGSILQSIRLPECRSLISTNADAGPINDGGTDGCVHATISIESQHIAPLPVAYRDRVYYPIGRVSGVWPISELRASLAYGVTIEKVHDCVYTGKMVTPFANVAAILLERRESLRSRKDARELACKYMLNAIPGRLGMREVTEIVSYRRWVSGRHAKAIEGAEIERVGNALYTARHTVLRRPSSTSNVLWASIITARARVGLLARMVESGNSLLYCDTDSIHSQSPIPTTNGVPGMLRDTGVYDTGIYLGAKYYSLETFDGTVDVRAKGIPRKYAVDFIANRHVAYQTALSVADGILRGISPCVWVDVERVATFAPGTRTLLDPRVLSGEVPHSDTAPVVFGMLESGGLEMTTRGMI